MGFYNSKMYFFVVEVEKRAKNEHFQVTIFKLRGGASRTSHVGRSVGRSVGPSVGPWKILTIFDIKVS